LPLILERFPRAREALARFAQAREEEEAFLEGVAEVRLLPDPRFFVPAFRALPLLKAPEAVRRRGLEGGFWRPWTSALRPGSSPFWRRP
jgi:tRNA(Ile)-lysidine synthase